MSKWEVSFIMDNATLIAFVEVCTDSDMDTIRSAAETLLVEEYGFYNWTHRVRSVYYSPIYSEE